MYQAGCHLYCAGIIESAYRFFGHNRRLALQDVEGQNRDVEGEFLQNEMLINRITNNSTHREYAHSAMYSHGYCNGTVLANCHVLCTP